MSDDAFVRTWRLDVAGSLVSFLPGETLAEPGAGARQHPGAGMLLGHWFLHPNRLKPAS